VRDTLRYIHEAPDLTALRQRAGVSSARMALVPQAAEVLRELVRTFKPHDIAISSYGIREGMLYEQMPQQLRDRDPLIEACRFTEAKDARVPGFGKMLYHFIMPLFKRARPERVRLIKAACLLHDVNWRAHPDYRADICFDTATRANLGGLKHSERVFLGLALLHRYSNSRSVTRIEKVSQMIDAPMRRDAEILGRAMRFGAMLWPQRDADPGKLHFYPKKRILEFNLAPEAAAMFGEVAQARFTSLAASLDSQPVVKGAIAP